MKRICLTFALLLAVVGAFAQTYSGGVTAKVINRALKSPVAGASVEVYLEDGTHIGSSKTGADGCFNVSGLQNGRYKLVVSADDFTPATVFAAVEKGFIRDLVFIGLTETRQIVDVDESNYAEFDLQDSGYSDSPTILYGSNDPYLNLASYGFSSVRFKNRGYNSETQDVLVAGVEMKDAITGYSPYSLWSGLNEALRGKDVTDGMAASEIYSGGFNGITSIMAVPSSVRPGLRVSALTNSSMYRGRIMATYASGVKDNGWAYAFSASARFGGNDWVEGVFYRSLGLYAGAEKIFNDEHRLALFAFATPGERGAQNASTQEVYDLMGDNMYNSNWGYQNGKVRNSRVRRTFEPVVGAKYDFTPSKELTVSATMLLRTGKNGYTALDWYDAMDPRPDYYRNLPSYFKSDESDYNRHNQDKAEWAEFAWTERSREFARYQHVDWDRMYNVNWNTPDGRSKYALEERHVDQNDFHIAGNVKWAPSELLTLTGGVQFRVNRTENYKVINDLLGGKYYVNIDQFAERDFASNEAFIQNDLDYFLRNGEARKITKGQKYGYDYLAQIRSGEVWANGIFKKGGLEANVAVTAGYNCFWRDGLMRKGLFAGLDDNGNEIEYDGTVLTTYDAKGNAITSKGKSVKNKFLTGSAKAGAAYSFRGGHRVYANIGYFADAPTFKQSFISARTRNSVIDGLKDIKTFSTDVNYQYSANGYNVRLTGYYTTINDQTDVMSFYDDSQQTFTNFAMSGIGERHMGIEAGFKIPTPVKNLTFSGALSLGEYIYTTTPHMVQSVDNSSKIVRDEDVPYWKHSPIYATFTDEDGSIIYDEDFEGNPVIKGYRKHYVPSTPQLAGELALNYNINYWFLELNGQYFAHSYLDMNPLYRTDFAVAGGDKIVTPAEVDALTNQEEFDPAFLLNLSIGKSWFKHGRQMGFSLSANNLLNNRCVRTGGYEQTRLIKSEGRDRYYAFDPKYFYMQGINYMLNIYFRF